MVQNSNKHF